MLTLLHTMHYKVALCIILVGATIAAGVTLIVPALDSLHTLVFLALCAITLFLVLVWFIDQDKFVGFFILCIPAIPLFQRFFPHIGWDDVTIEILSLEILFLFLLLVLWLAKRNTDIPVSLRNCLKTFNGLIFAWIGLNLVATLFSIDIYRSSMMFFIGVLSPALVFYLIANKTKVSYRMLGFLLFSLVGSGVVFILLGSVLNLIQVVRGGVDPFDLVELRGGNIYGPGAVIGAITFMLPLVFVRRLYWQSLIGGKGSNIFRLVLFLFTVLSVLGIVFAVSRWAYAVFLATSLLVLFFDRGYSKLYRLVPLIVGSLFMILAFEFVGEAIAYRFLHGAPFTLEHIQQQILADPRWGIWQNAWAHFKDHAIFGIGMGNHSLISPRGFTTAHNIFLNILVERGVLVWAIFLGIIGFFYKVSFKFRKNARNQKLRRLSLFLSFGMTVFLIWAVQSGDLIQASGFVSAIRAHYFSFILGLQLYIMKLDGLRPQE